MNRGRVTRACRVEGYEADQIRTARIRALASRGDIGAANALVGSLGKPRSRTHALIGLAEHVDPIAVLARSDQLIADVDEGDYADEPGQQPPPRAAADRQPRRALQNPSCVSLGKCLWSAATWAPDDPRIDQLVTDLADH